MAKEKDDNLPATRATGTELQVIDYGEDQGAGMEDMRRDEFKIPMMAILQGLSPQVKPVSAGGLDGAKPGMIFNTATNELFDGDKGLLFIPCNRDYNFVEYIPRDSGGGFVGIHTPDEPMVETILKTQNKFKQRLQTREGNDLIETYYLFGLLVSDDSSVAQVVVPFKSTQITKYQSFFTRYNSITYPNSKGERVRPPLWAHRWRLGTTFQQSKKGDFYGWKITLEQEPPIKSRMTLDDPLYQMGAGFYNMIKAGKAQVQHAEADNVASGDHEGDEPF